MNETDMSNSSETNWEMINAMSDDMIDRSETPPLDDSFFERAQWRKPTEPIEVIVKIEPTLFAWFQDQGEDYEQRMIAALRIYAEAHKQSTVS